jgi:hypothetical protein
LPVLNLVSSKMKALAEDTDPKAEEMLIRLWRAASPREKLAKLLDAYRTALGGSPIGGVRP